GAQNQKLTPYTLVSKSWQPAFEKQIYSSVVLLSPSEVTSITVSPDQRVQKRGLSLARLDEITSGPEHWRVVRRKWVRRILYRVAVPYWLDPGREKDDDFTYDNICRRENDETFSRGVSLDIALQAENASSDEDSGEPESSTASGDSDQIAPYRADLLPDCSLPRARCITSLNCPTHLTPAMIPGEYGILDRPCAENQISLPAVFKILSACGAVQEVRLDATSFIPSTEPEMLQEYRMRIVNGLFQLPSSIRSLNFCWSPTFQSEVSETRPLDGSTEPDSLCIALHKISTRLQHLHIEDVAVFPELFCPHGPPRSSGAYWPHLE
ncbi:hypothetical protein M436DRAFT_19969, partial [Aureobasidium namibiae CBS 147.97]